MEDATLAVARVRAASRLELQSLYNKVTQGNANDIVELAAVLLHAELLDGHLGGEVLAENYVNSFLEGAWFYVPALEDSDFQGYCSYGQALRCIFNNVKRQYFERSFDYFEQRPHELPIYTSLLNTLERAVIMCCAD